MIKNVLVTGANGQLGQALRKRAGSYPSFSFYYTDIDTLDITDKAAVQAYLNKNRIHTIINTAAYTAVDQAEKEAEQAYRINAEAVKVLAEAARDHHSRLLHVSTDYVFDGLNHRPYIETDGTHPASAYGRTKLAGEVLLQETLETAVIVRTSWLYSETGNNFMKTMLRLGAEREELRVVFDQIGTPTYAGDLAEALLTILDKEEHGAYVPGIYHYSNEGVCSWYDFARKIMELGGLSCRVMPIETKNYPTPAARPAYSVLNKTKIKETYGLVIPHWEESLRRIMNDEL